MKFIHLIIIFIIIPVNLFADVVPDGGEHVLAMGGGGHQSGPAIEIWGGGGVAVWENSGQTGTRRIVAQRLNEMGKGVGAVRVISQNLEKVNDTNPAVKRVGAGGSVVVWCSGHRGNTDIYMAMITMDGSRMGEITRVNQQTDRRQTNPSIGVSEDGYVMVVWQSDGQDGDGSGVYGRVYNDAGEPTGDEVLLSQTTAGDQTEPYVVGLEERRFFVVWVSETVNGKNENGGLKLRSQVMGRFFQRSNAQYDEFRISGSDVIVSNPVIHRGINGKLYLGWMQRIQENSHDKYDIWGVDISRKNGVPERDPIQINEYSSGEQSTPQIVSQGDEVIFVWESVGQDLGGHGIVGRKYLSGEEFVINSQRNLDQYDPAVAADGQGKVIVAWANTINSGNSVISAQHFRIGKGNLVIAANGEMKALQTGDLLAPAPNLMPIIKTDIPKVVATPRKNGDTVEAKTPTMAAPEFPKSSTASSAAKAVAALANVRSGATTSRMTVAPSQPTAASFAINRFPTRSSLRSGLTTPGQAASSALQQMATQLQQLRSGSSSAFGNRIRSGSYGSGQSTASLSRAAMMNPALRSTAANTFQRPTVRSGAYPRTSTFAARNSSGVGAVRSLTSRPGTTSSIRSGTAQNRFELMRQQAQNASSQLTQTRQVPASLQLQGSQMNLQWQGRSGTRYQVQGSNDRVSWQNHGGIRSGTETSSAAVDRSYRYYRVVERN